MKRETSCLCWNSLISIRIKPLSNCLPCRCCAKAKHDIYIYTFLVYILPKDHPITYLLPALFYQHQMNHKIKRLEDAPHHASHSVYVWWHWQGHKLVPIDLQYAPSMHLPRDAFYGILSLSRAVLSVDVRHALLYLLGTSFPFLYVFKKSLSGLNYQAINVRTMQ